MSPSDVRKLIDDFAEANRDRETLKQRCHDLEIKVNMLEDEKNNVVAEYENLQKMVSAKITFYSFYHVTYFHDFLLAPFKTIT